MTITDQFEKAIKFISNGIRNCTEPESLEGWCKTAKTNAGYDKCAHSFSSLISYRLDRIENLQGFSLMEKVRLVFLFSRPVSPGFFKVLKDAKCIVKLNNSRRITYFRSPEGDCVFQSKQDSNPKQRKFKGKPIQEKPRLFNRDDDCEKAIKFISNGIKNYTEPENLLKWCELAKTEVVYDKSADSFKNLIKKRLDKIEGLKGYSLMEKVHLVFIFNRPVSPGFIEILKDAKCLVELNDKGKITYFRSEDRDIVLQLEHKKRNFKGKPCTEQKNTADIQVKIPHNVQTQSPPASPQSLLGPPEMDDVEMTKGEEETAQEKEKQEIRAPEVKKEENKDTSTNQKSTLNTEEDVDVTTESIQQEAPFNGQIDYDDLDNGEYSEFMVPANDESPNHHKKRHPDLIQENPKRRKIDKPEEPEVANPPEINDVEMRNEEEEAIGQTPRDSDDLGPIVDDNLKIQNQDVRAGDQDNNYDDLDIGEYPEFTLPNEIEPPSQHQKRQSEPSQENAKRLKIDKPEESEVANPPQINDVETRNEEREEAPEQIPEDSEEPSIRVNNESNLAPNADRPPNHHNKKHQNLSQENDSEESESEDEAPENVSDSQISEHSRIQNELDEQELEDVTYLKHERSFDGKPEKRYQNSRSSKNANRVKIEEWDEDFFAAPDAPETLNNPEEPKISVLLLANQIGIIALYCDLEDVQKKASQAIEIIKRKEREMTLNVADFNSYIDSMLKSIKGSRNRYSRQTEKSLPLKTIYRHFKLSLILPFGPEVTGEALKIVDKAIEELEESHDEVPLETARGNLEYLLNSSTGFWI
ncbi:unnamed protein product [Caenorhabditis nigoni]